MALTVLLVLPVAGAIGVLFCRARGQFEAGRRLALAVAIASLLAVGSLWAAWDYSSAGLQMVERTPWVMSPAAMYHVGIDGSGLVFLTLVASVLVFALAASARLGRRAPAGLAATLLVAGAAATGVIVSRDLLLWYACGEVMVFATYAAVGGWGHERRVYAATRFLMCQLVGGSILLVALVWMAWRHQVTAGTWSFALDDLVAMSLPLGIQRWIWFAFIAAYALRMPLVPVHTWLGDLLAQASTPSALLIGGAIVPAGAYGLVRIAVPIVPDAAATFGAWLIVPAVIGIVYGGVTALGQTDLRRMTASLLLVYISVAVACVATATAAGLIVAATQLVAAGVIATAWLLVTAMLAERRQTTRIAEFGGLWRVAPGLSIVVIGVAAAAMALPGTLGFATVATALDIVSSSSIVPYADVVIWSAVGGVLALGAAVVLTAQQVVGGRDTNDRNRALRDLTAAEWLMIAPLGIAVLVMGLWPEVLPSFMAPLLDIGGAGLSLPGLP